MATFKETVKDYASRGKESLLSFSSKAGEKLQDTSDKVIKNIDIRRLQKRRQSLYADLGCYVFEHTGEGKRLSLKTAEVELLFSEITQINNELDGQNLQPAEL